MADSSLMYSDYFRSESSPENSSSPQQVAHNQSDASSLPLTFPEYDRSLGVGPSTFSRSVQFQVPHFILGGPPNVAPGGGAEVMPGMLASVSPGPSSGGWFVNDFARYGESNDYSDASYYNHASDSTSHHSSPFYHQPIPITSQTSAVQETDNDDKSGSLTLSNTTFQQSVGPSQINPRTFPLDAAQVGVPLNVQPLLYSASGFDVLAILARVATRPKPKIVLGAVDMTCSFVFVDVRRYDNPVVYASPTFYQLTGYSESEVLGRNCRFLQSPEGKVERGEERKYTSPEAVTYLKKSLVADKECQTSLINYRKDGRAFINLITVIPVPGDDGDEIAFHVGFQVDLTEQPNAILKRLNDGSYIVNYGASLPTPSTVAKRTRTRAISKELRKIISTPMSSIPDSSEKERQDLNSLILDNSHDFIHVLSLKGSFQYVSPTVRDILGYDASEMVGKSISDICHPADVTPVLRELKESSVTLQPADASLSPPIKTVNLLFRARTKSSGYVWIESQGRLHVEPGKGRKSIILSGRLREFPRLSWTSIHRAGGTSANEFWGQLSADGLWLVVSPEVETQLSYSPAQVLGSSILQMVPAIEQRMSILQMLHDTISGVRPPTGENHIQVVVDFVGRGDLQRRALLICYLPDDSLAPPDSLEALRNTASMRHSCPAPIVCQVRFLNDDHAKPSQIPPSYLMSRSLGHSRSSPLSIGNVFEELDTTRHTSWQYELTQLRFANKRLKEEVAELENRIESEHASSSSTTQLDNIMRPIIRTKKRSRPADDGLEP
ncbi:hypothetical protein SISSUDRAFT_1124704 [Sistotremastrum suecicum HHB10207 ss-3]|uniref:PAS domain-containing protein n=1 Tax=Sistotremastrum suecicum HHB10207 ss-3 TaxID=1314776 RepID=A0A166IAP3_9AGAM|nr:hypothetical protein SISSUDRAFT_1124704 [Sistotremastrum suecicum HHB10207 ss-3]